LGCDCPSNFEGSHCQFVKGTKPAGWPFTTEGPYDPNGSSSATSSGSDAGEIAALLMVLFAVAVVIGAIIYKRVNSPIEVAGSGDKYHGATGRDLELNADGEMLKDAMEESQSRMDNGNGNSENPSFPSFS